MEKKITTPFPSDSTSKTCLSGGLLNAKDLLGNFLNIGQDVFKLRVTKCLSFTLSYSTDPQCVTIVFSKLFTAVVNTMVKTNSGGRGSLCDLHIISHKQGNSRQEPGAVTKAESTEELPLHVLLSLLSIYQLV